VLYCVQRPADGALIDAYGAYVSDPFADIAARCGGSAFGWKQINARDWCYSMSDADRREVDEDLLPPWFEMIFPRSDRLPKPIRY
jgi:hypothetical protein